MQCKESHKWKQNKLTNKHTEENWGDPGQHPGKSTDVHQERHEKQTCLDEYQFPG